MTCSCPSKEQDSVPPTRGQKPVEETYTGPWTDLTTRGQTAEARRTCSSSTAMQPAEMRPQAQKVRQNKTTEKHVAEEGTR